MKEYQTYTKPANKRLVNLYRAGLENLDQKLAELFKAGVPPTTEITALLKDELRVLIAQRQKIIKDNLYRGSQKAYTDVLYQAGRLLGIDVPKTVISDADSAALIRKRPRSVPSFSSLVKKHQKDTLAITPKRAVSNLPAKIESPSQVKDAFRKALTVDANISIRFVNAEMTRVINNAVNLAFETVTNPEGIIGQLIAATGQKMVKVWIHDSPMVPREYHRDVLDGSIPDRDGYWYQDGDRATGPGGFSDPKNNMNCRCTIEIMTVKEYLDTYGRSRLQPWSYLPE